MKDFKLKGTDKAPEVRLISSEGRIEFKGKSIPENTNLFYDDIILWIEQYVTEPHYKTIVKIQMEYFNTMTSKCLHKIFKTLEQASDVEIFWYYEEDDEDMLEVGEDFESIIDLQFKMIEVEEL